MRPEPFRLPCLLFLLILPFQATAFQETLALTKAKRGEVAFSHLRHAQQYDIKCERCHHNTTTKPPDAFSCKECHLNKEHKGLCHECHLSDRDDRYKADYEALSKRLKKQEIPTLYRAFHSLCRNCHMAENSTKKTKAPVDCGGCHR